MWLWWSKEVEDAGGAWVCGGKGEGDEVDEELVAGGNDDLEYSGDAPLRDAKG